MEDKIIVCKICGKEFLFSVNEQIFYLDKDFTDPKSCSQCRKNKKKQ